MEPARASPGVGPAVDATPAPEKCANCGAALTGPYCGEAKILA